MCIAPHGTTSTRGRSAFDPRPALALALSHPIRAAAHPPRVSSYFVFAFAFVSAPAPMTHVPTSYIRPYTSILTSELGSTGPRSLPFDLVRDRVNLRAKIPLHLVQPNTTQFENGPKRYCEDNNPGQNGEICSAARRARDKLPRTPPSIACTDGCMSIRILCA
ncbi:hypothetical protein FB451DRAFT_477681 [Mycena latifolia]|nr:hypothetical protein FB451DRAFT_477681 [Mycena latifolia]